MTKTEDRPGTPGADTGKYFRRGLGLKREIQPVMDAEYASGLVSLVRESGYELRVGRM